MDFTVEFYETETGKRPVQEFLDELKASDPDDFAAVVAGLAKLRNRQYHREPLSKAIGDGLFELRHVGKLNTRVLWFFMKNRRIVLLHAIRNKDQAIPARELDTARERMRDWRKRVVPSEKPTSTTIWTSNYGILRLPPALRAPARHGMLRCRLRRYAKRLGYPRRISPSC